MQVPSYLLPDVAVHHAKLANTGLGPAWDAAGVSLRCKVTPKRRRVGRQRESAGDTRAVVDTARVQTNYPALAVDDQVVWTGRTMVVLAVSDVPSPWGNTAWWDAELGDAP